MASGKSEGFVVTDDFYRAFEDRHRGGRSLIKSRLKAYLPFILPLKHRTTFPVAIDLGCGRGEWLELLTEHGIPAKGVDLDDGMLSACLEAGLTVQNGDAIAFLSAQPNQSADIVSAFHVVEHIGFENLRVVVAEALRVLTPGGILLLETPNPENLLVSGSGFYMDPTHERPIPPALLSFVVENAGFDRVKTVRLQEDPALHDDTRPLSLWDVFRGVSPDYSVVAQKGGDEDALRLTEAAFTRDYGLTLQELASRYESTLRSRMDTLTRRIKAAEIQAIRAEVSATRRAHQAESDVQRTLNQLNAVYASNSWKITAPIRLIVSTVRDLRGKSLRTVAKAVLKRGASYVGRRPGLRHFAVQVINHFPGLKARVRSLVMPAAHHGADVIDANMPVSELTPRVRRIYAELKTIFKS